MAWWCWPAELHGLHEAWQRIDAGAWVGLLYVSVCSTWLGFFFWYAALAKDALRVSQVQLLQPFLAVLLSAWLLGEAVPAATWVFALAVLTSMGMAQRVSRPASVRSAAVFPTTGMPDEAWRRT
jgi:drug/metabolite transporter (DMT)-like permease